VLPILLLALARLRARDARANTESTRSAENAPFPFLPAVVLLVCTAALLTRILAVRAGAGWRDVYYPTHLRADALAFGVMIGYCHRYFPVRFERVCRMWPLLLAAVPMSLLVPALFPLTTSGVTFSVGFTLLYLAYGGLVALAARYPGFGHSVAPMRWAAAVGRYSYTIYLAHGAMEILPRYGRSISLAGRLGGVWAQRALFVGLAAIGGVALAWLVERPVLRLRERWLPARRLAPAAMGETPAAGATRRLGIPDASDSLLSPVPQSAAGPREVNG
jgi:peptidoglycan/LPS O-acetylase OafA/YrhL